ncbi:MAG: ARPP-1 family domain-containing protein [Promethearchaeota archaeon]
MSSWKKILLDHLEFGTTQTKDGVSVIPLKLASVFEMHTLAQAAEQGMVEVLESESVNELRLAYSSPIPTLIPYLQVVAGGKQDRMLTEPIILSSATKEKEIITVPVNCIERGRWEYSRRSTGEQTSSKFKVHHARMNPSVGFANVKAAQSATWGSVDWYQKKREVAMEIAPSQSFIEVEEAAQEVTEKESGESETLQELKEFIESSGDLIPKQTGLALFVDNELIGVELYGTPQIWEGQKEAVCKSYFSEVTLQELKKSDVREDLLKNILINALNKLVLKQEETEGQGNLFIARSDEDHDYSALLIEYDGKIAEFYYAKGEKELLTSTQHPEPVQMETLQQRIIDPVETELTIQQEIMGEKSPDEEDEDD